MVAVHDHIAVRTDPLHSQRLVCSHPCRPGVARVLFDPAVLLFIPGNNFIVRPDLREAKLIVRIRMQPFHGRFPDEHAADEPCPDGHIDSLYLPDLLRKELLKLDVSTGHMLFPRFLSYISTLANHCVLFK